MALLSDYDFLERALLEYENNNSSLKHAECIHDETIDDNGIIVCIGCGREIEKNIQHEKEWRFYGSGEGKLNGDPNRVQMRKLEVRSIHKDVEHMNLSEKVVDIADKIFMECTNGGIYRGESRRSRIFGSVYYAYKILGNPQPKNQLIEMFGIDNSSASEGLKFIIMNSPQDSKVHNAFTTTEDLIIDIMSKFEASQKQKDQVVSLFKKIKNRSSELNRARPYSVTCALVYYWMKRTHKDIKLTDYVKIVGLADNTIIRLVKEISLIFGKNIDV